MTPRPPRPRAFRLDDIRVAVDDGPAPFAPDAVIQSHNEPIPVDAGPKGIDEDELQIEVAQKSGLLARWRLSLGGVLTAGFGGLVSLAFGLWTTNLIEGLFAKAESLGVIGLIFGVLFLVGLIGLAAREIIAVARQTRIAEMHVEFARARAADDRDDRASARRPAGRRSTKAGPKRRGRRAEVEEASRAIIDGRDLIDVAERALLRPLDLKAQVEIAAAAKRVSLVTAISPRAILDVIFVIAQIIRLVRRIAEIYGGRPGCSASSSSPGRSGRISRSPAAWRSATASSSRFSATASPRAYRRRMGEGVLNGLLTTRVGLSALAVCRPAPFGRGKAARRLRSRAVPVQQGRVRFSADVG